MAKRQCFVCSRSCFTGNWGFPSSKIKGILEKPGFDILTALGEHKKGLEQKVKHLGHLIETVDRTIEHLQGEKQMSDKNLFEGFSNKQQEEYAKQAEQMYDPETVRESNRKWKSYSPEKKMTILDEGKQIYIDLVEAMPEGAGSPEVQALIERWHNHLDYFWTPNLDQLLGLVTMYGQSADFKAKFDQMHPILADFMKEAVEIYVANHRK